MSTERYQWEKDHAHRVVDELALKFEAKAPSPDDEATLEAIECVRKGLCPDHDHVAQVMKLFDVRFTVQSLALRLRLRCIAFAVTRTVRAL